MNIVVTVLFLMICFYQAPAAYTEIKQAHTSEIANLLGQLYPIETEDRVKIPSIGTRQNVETRLTHLAEQSLEGRTEVIQALINVVKDPKAKSEWPVARRWILAVDLLGTLRATEAVEVLINSLGHTGENGIMSSVHFQPVARALGRLGSVAVPGLIQALAREEEEIRFQAEQTLASIGKPAIPNLLDALYANQATTKRGAARVLTLMGGLEARLAIEHSIELEQNEERRNELREALVEFNRRWREQN
jgi:HEAT repeat protein